MRRSSVVLSLTVLFVTLSSSCGEQVVVRVEGLDRFANEIGRAVGTAAITSAMGAAAGRGGHGARGVPDPGAARRNRRGGLRQVTTPAPACGG